MTFEKHVDARSETFLSLTCQAHWCSSSRHINAWSENRKAQSNFCFTSAPNKTGCDWGMTAYCRNSALEKNKDLKITLKYRRVPPISFHLGPFLLKSTAAPMTQVLFKLQNKVQHHLIALLKGCFSWAYLHWYGYYHYWNARVVWE